LGVLPFVARAALAQTRASTARIGIVEFGGPPPGGFANIYVAALKRLGYSEPDTLQIERRYAEGDAARFAELLKDLASRNVDVVFAIGNDIANVAKQVVPGLSVVAAGSEDPVMSGLIREYRRPGGNITGVTYLSPQLASKRLELLKEAIPGLARVAVLWDPSHFDTYYKDMQPVAAGLEIRLQLLEVRVPTEIDSAIATAQKARAQALFIVPSRMVNLEARRISRLTLGARLPVMAAYANFTDAGGLMSYGAVAGEMLSRAAAQTVRILKGAKAGDLPFEQAATFELVINLKTAREIGLAIPQSMLVRADRVIE
jgi:putative ABC transport system substrate-binding protein